jgi:hypothetical protein
MKRHNPRVFLREGELYAFVEEVPTEPSRDYIQDLQHREFIFKIEYKKWQDAIECAKASAIKVKNQDETKHLLLKALNWNPVPGEHRFDEGVVYTLEGYQMEVVEEKRYRPKLADCGLIPQAYTVKLAIISPVVENKKPMKIDKVYYSPEGVVTCSPGGWPEEQHYADYEAGTFDQISLHAAEEKAIASSVPFEDQKDIFMRIRTANMPKFASTFELKENSFYTIEPVEVEIGYQYKPSKDSTDWIDCHVSVWQEYTNHESKQFGCARRFARILPKVKKPGTVVLTNCTMSTSKIEAGAGDVEDGLSLHDVHVLPAPYRDTPWGGEIPEDYVAPVVEQKQEPQTIKYQICPKCQGQGIVSKPPWIAAEVTEWSSATSVSHTCDVCNGGKIILPYIVPQEREWIPVTERLPSDMDVVLVWSTTTLHPTIAYFFKGDWLYYSINQGCFWLKEYPHIIINYWQPLPQPPKI